MRQKSPFIERREENLGIQPRALPTGGEEPEKLRGVKTVRFRDAVLFGTHSMSVSRKIEIFLYKKPENIIVKP